VPRSYFDTLEDGQVISDEDGLEFASLEAAEYEAARSAAEIGRDQLPKGVAPEITVRIRDEHGDQVLTVTVSMTICRPN
jgi:hypothetical protein